MNRFVVQTLMAFLLSVPSFMVAVGNTWTSYSLLILESEESPLGYKITKNDGSLLSSVISLGSLGSLAFVGYINDKLGRRRSEILCGLCYIVAWAIVTTAKTVTQLLIGRLLMGLGTGLHLVTGVVYLSEISEISIKGPLLSIMSFMYNVGALVSYVEGWFCSYEVINYLNLTVAVGFVLLLLCVKETPVFLLRTGREKEAINSLKFYRGSFTVTQEILDEIVYMKSQLTNDNNTEKTDLKTSQLESEKLNQDIETVNDVTTDAEQPSVWSTLRKSKAAQRALVILVIHMVLTVFMGMAAVQAYAGQFFTQASPSLSPHLCSVLLAVVITVISGVSVVIVDLIPRRVLMIATCVVAAGCMACLATMLHWSWAPEWGIPLVMVIYCVGYHLGTVNIAFIQLAETLPPQMSCVGAGVVMGSMCVGNFAVLYTFQPAIDAFGLAGVFFMFGIIGLITALVSFLLMRETRRVPYEIVNIMFEQGFLYRRPKLQ